MMLFVQSAREVSLLLDLPLISISALEWDEIHHGYHSIFYMLGWEKKLAGIKTNVTRFELLFPVQKIQSNIQFNSNRIF